MPDAALLDSPLIGAEFLAVDTETSGQPKERCELTEVGAVLVGGGELHDRWSSLVGVSEPLGRGIQRFTGITQEMVDHAPPPEAVLPELAARLRGRILVAHNAAFDKRVLRQTCARVLCALLPRLCAAAFTVGEALAVLRPKNAGRRRAPGAKRPRDQRPDLSKLPKDPGVYIFRDADGRPIYVGKSVCLRVRARAHFTTPVAWTG